jgi:2-polyprenyl-6-methoxyphenol hydroxylase-like FAD-dependent oxidoreductase
MPDSTEVDTNPKPTVIIVGAGLGGLLLGALLERVDIPYIILERASSFKPLGRFPSTSPSPLLTKCLTAIV